MTLRRFSCLLSLKRLHLVFMASIFERPCFLRSRVVRVHFALIYVSLCCSITSTRQRALFSLRMKISGDRVLGELQWANATAALDLVGEAFQPVAINYMHPLSFFLMYIIRVFIFRFFSKRKLKLVVNSNFLNFCNMWSAAVARCATARNYEINFFCI